MEETKRQKYNRLKNEIANIVKRTIKEREVIYGERALEARFPPQLQRKTDDFDIYSKRPKKDALEAEQELDNRFGGDYFKVVPAKHKGTWKVKANVDDKTYADFTKPKTKIDSDKILGYKYQTLKQIREQRLAASKKKANRFRKAKDIDAVKRIDTYRKIEAMTRQGVGKPKQKWL